MEKKEFGESGKFYPQESSEELTKEDKQEKQRSKEVVDAKQEKEELEFREKILSRGEYCGRGVEGHLQALKLATEGKGTPAYIEYKGKIEWVVLREQDFEDLKEIVPHLFNKGKLEEEGRCTWDFSEPIYHLYYGDYWRFAEPKKRIKKYQRNLRELKKEIADIDEMYNFAKTNGEIIKSGGGMSRIKIGKTYIVDKEGATYVVSEEGYERIYESINELVEAIGAKGASEPEEDGQPGTVYWGEGWQGGIGGGVTLVEINGKKYYRQI